MRNVCIHLELVAVLQTLLDHVQMEVAHSGDDQLVRLRVAANREGGVFVGDLGQAGRDLCLVVACLGLHGPRHHRNRELDRLGAKLRNDGVAAHVADGVRDVQVVELGDGDDVAGDRFGDLFLLLPLHHVDMPGLGGLSAAEIDDRRVVRQPTAQDSQIAELAHELIVDGLEHLGDQRALLGGEDFLFGRVGCFAASAEAVDVGRGEPAVGDQVEQLFETQVLACADAEHGYELALGDRVVCCFSQLVGRDRFAFQVAHHQLFVELDDLLDDHAIGFGGGKRAERRGLHRATG